MIFFHSNSQAQWYNTSMGPQISRYGTDRKRFMLNEKIRSESEGLGYSTFKSSFRNYINYSILIKRNNQSAAPIIQIDIFEKRVRTMPC